MTRKLYSKYFLFCLALLIALISLFEFAAFSEAKDSFSKNLPKTKDTSTASKSKVDKKEVKLKKSDKKSEKSKEEVPPDEEALADDIEEKSDPSKNYKLIAIYLIGNRPRVLLKDLSNTDEPPKEFQLGDFLDEEQTVSISKINFNPTARIELTDLDGISYLLKPQNTEDSKSATSSSSSLSKPTYFSSGKGKISKRSTSTPASPVKVDNAPPPSNPPPVEQAAKKDEPPNNAVSAQSPAGSAPPPAQALMAAPDSSAPAAGATTLSTGSGASVTGSGPGGGSADAPKADPGMDSMGDVARPANPFE